MAEHRTLTAPAGAFRATETVPGDKSLSHRALIFAAMARGESVVTNCGPGGDVASTAAVLRRLGVQVDGDRVASPGVGSWSAAAEPLDCGNSGTTLRALTGALAGQPHATTLTGDASLRSRPMRRLVGPLRALGARLQLSPEDTAPVTVGPSDGLRGADTEIPVASAQVRTAFELAAVQADGFSHIASPPGFRDHTERWLATMGLGERTSPTQFRIYPGEIPPYRYEIPGDPSSAAFLWAAAAIRQGAEVTTPDVSLNPGRLGFLQILEQMGAEVEAEVTRALLGDPVGSVTVRGRGLVGARISGPVVAAALDELPLVAVLASFADGMTRVSDAAELRVKESDRIVTSCAMVRALGGAAEERADGFEVVGLGWLEPGDVDAADDHRIAMAAAVAATGVEGPVTVRGADAAAVSWPGFFERLERLWSSQ